MDQKYALVESAIDKSGSTLEAHGIGPMTDKRGLWVVA